MVGNIISQIRQAVAEEVVSTMLMSAKRCEMVCPQLLHLNESFTLSLVISQ